MDMTIFEIPLIVVVIAIMLYFGFKEYLRVQKKNLFSELKRDSQKQTLPLRLAAYERLVLLIERISPSSLFVRVSPLGLSASEMHAICLNEIRNEFEHNLSQQIYVSEGSWQAVKKTKDETLLMLHTISTSLAMDATGLDYSRAVLEHIGSLQSDNYSLTNKILSREAALLF